MNDGPRLGSTSTIRVQRDGPVALLWLSDAAKRNALTPQMANAVSAAVAEIGADSSVGSLVIAADGPDFCSGADLALLERSAAEPLSDTALSDLDAIYSMFLAVRNAAVPTVAAVQGRAVGAGLNVALMCDLCLVSDNAHFKGFGAAGVHPGGGHLSLVGRHSRTAVAAVALFNQELSAERAVELGLAWEVVPVASLQDEALRLAHAAAADPPLAREVTRTLRRVDQDAARVALSASAERTSQLWSLQRRFARPS